MLPYANSRGGSAIFTASCLFMAATAHGQMVITPAGAALGLSLTTFATGFPNFTGSSVGPLGIAFPSSGGVLVSDYPGNVRLFPTDTDGQDAAMAPIGQNYGATNAVGIAQIGGSIYMTQKSPGAVVQINNNGTFNRVIVTGTPQAEGLAANPANGHLFISTSGTGIIYDIDPIANTKTVFVNLNADGLTVSPDGKTLYAAAASGHILGFETATKALIFDSGLVPGGLDGTALGGGIFGNTIFANTNSGQLFEINLTSLSRTLIGTGGSRGDFVSPDLLNGTLLITQRDRILRLNGVVLAGPPVPEPSVLTFVAALSAAGLLFTLPRHRRQ